MVSHSSTTWCFCFSGKWRLWEMDSLRFWTSDIQDLHTSCRKFLCFIFLFVFSVLYTKHALKSAQFNRKSTNFFLTFYSFPHNWVKTEAQVWPAYAHHEFVVLDSNVRPHGQRRRSAAACLLGSWVRFPPEACRFVCCEWCVFSCTGLCDELITRPEESHRLWCVVVCDLENLRMRPWPAFGLGATGEGGGGPAT